MPRSLISAACARNEKEGTVGVRKKKVLRIVSLSQVGNSRRGVWPTLHARARARVSLCAMFASIARRFSLSLSLPYLLESDVLGVLPETPPAHLKPVLADDSVVASAHAAESKSESENEVKFIGQPCRPVRGRALSLPPRSTGHSWSRLAGQVESSLFPPCRPSVARTYQGWEPRPYFLG